MDYSRDEYEKFAIEDARSVGVTLNFYRDGDWYGGMQSNDLNTGWACWKASRESLLRFQASQKEEAEEFRGHV